MQRYILYFFTCIFLSSYTYTFQDVCQQLINSELQEDEYDALEPNREWTEIVRETVQELEQEPQPSLPANTDQTENTRINEAFEIFDDYDDEDEDCKPTGFVRPKHISPIKLTKPLKSSPLFDNNLFVDMENNDDEPNPHAEIFVASGFVGIGSIALYKALQTLWQHQKELVQSKKSSSTIEALLTIGIAALGIDFGYTILSEAIKKKEIRFR